MSKLIDILWCFWLLDVVNRILLVDESILEYLIVGAIVIDREWNIFVILNGNGFKSIPKTVLFFFNKYFVQW